MCQNFYPVLGLCDYNQVVPFLKNFQWNIPPGYLSSVQSLSRIRLFVTLWTAWGHGSMPGLPVHQQLPEFTQTHIHWVGDAIQPSHPLLSPSPPAFNLSQHQGNESALCIRWPKYWSFSFSISPSTEYSGLISLGWTGWLSLQSKGLSRLFSNTTVQKHQFFGAQLSL